MTIGGVLTLWHEIGHIIEQSSIIYDNREYINPGQLLNIEEGALALRRERDAWAFALAKLRPFLRSDDRVYALKYIHRIGLASHSEGLRGTIAPRIIIKLMRYLERIIEQRKSAKPE